jgi:nitrogen PTS system EIIA component
MNNAEYPSHNGASLTTFFNVNNILVLQNKVTRNQAIQTVLTQLSHAENIADLDRYIQAVIERENSGSTAIGNGVALPHARFSNISRPYIGIATSADGIDFGNENTPVHLIMAMLIPTSQPGLYLQILRAMGTVLNDPDTIIKLSQMKSANEIMRFFQRDGLTLPEYVCAADIMHKNLITLRDNDSLQCAVDCFINKELDEIPVVDKDGDMVGIVSADALLQVCLPEYLTWMNDLSPIINFEPFTNVLRNEQNTWLSDILIENFPSVQLDEPAISVAATLLKRKAATCYVLDKKRLKGAISLPNFLNKIFRE